MGYWGRAFRFAGVGATGTFLNLGILALLTEYLHIHYLYSEVIAILITFLWNYNGNILVGNIRRPETGVFRNLLSFWLHRRRSRSGERESGLNVSYPEDRA